MVATSNDLFMTNIMEIATEYSSNRYRSRPSSAIVPMENLLFLTGLREVDFPADVRHDVCSHGSNLVKFRGGSGQYTRCT